MERVFIPIPKEEQLVITARLQRIRQQDHLQRSEEVLEVFIHLLLQEVIILQAIILDRRPQTTLRIHLAEVQVRLAQVRPVVQGLLQDLQVAVLVQGLQAEAEDASKFLNKKTL